MTIPYYLLLSYSGGLLLLLHMVLLLGVYSHNLLLFLLEKGTEGLGTCWVGWWLSPLHCFQTALQFIFLATHLRLYVLAFGRGLLIELLQASCWISLALTNQGQGEDFFLLGATVIVGLSVWYITTRHGKPGYWRLDLRGLVSYYSLTNRRLTNLLQALLAWDYVGLVVQVITWRAYSRKWSQIWASFQRGCVILNYMDHLIAIEIAFEIYLILLTTMLWLWMVLKWQVFLFFNSANYNIFL